jgi:hypothetical protein
MIFPFEAEQPSPARMQKYIWFTGSPHCDSSVTSRTPGVIPQIIFERHKAAELYILSLVDDAHPPAAQLLDDAVVRDGLTDHVWPINE